MSEVIDAQDGGAEESGERRVLLIGDVHAKIGRFARTISAHAPEYSIQLGDFGMRYEHLWFMDHMDVERHKVIFGNHDYMPFLDKPHSLGDWSFPFPGVMTIRGASSIDRRFRSTGLNWWPNEEISYQKMQACVEAYREAKPRLVISHDCPDAIRRKSFGIHDTSRTSDGLQDCFEEHQPDLWFFGHHHASLRRTLHGTEFVCLDELETCTVTIGPETLDYCPETAIPPRQTDWRRRRSG